MLARRLLRASAVGGTMSDATGGFHSDRRGFFRVQTRLPLGIRGVAPAEVGRLCAEILRRTPQAPSDVAPGLASWLARIEEKLDLLLEKNAAGDEPELQKREREVVLSGSGLLLPGETYIPDFGSKQLVEFDLPLQPRYRVRCLARVAGTRSHEGSPPALALGFACIHEEDRDAIVRHNLILQRRERSSQPRSEVA